MITAVLVVNVLFVVFLILVGSDRNIESRTEKEEKILRGEEN
jgi:hypothetical protein